jgi:hypothetical protein
MKVQFSHAHVMPRHALNFKLKGVENTLSNATLTTIVNSTQRMPNRDWFVAGRDYHNFPPQSGGTHRPPSSFQG